MPIDFSFLEGATSQKESTPIEFDTVNVTIRVDADSLLLCDGDYIDHPFKDGALTKIQLPLGQHLLEFLSEENPDVKVEKVVDLVEAGKSYLVIVNELKAALAEVADTCIIPEGVEALESQQEFMRYYKGESKVKLPSTLKRLGDYKGETIFGDTERETRNKHKWQIEELRDDNEFEDASRLEKILEKEEKEKICIKHIDLSRCTKLESIGEKTFSYCYDLSKVILPNSLKEIQSYAFYHCERLREIVIPSSVTSIGKSAFYNCSALASVVIPNSVTSIGESAFYHCSALASVVIPNSVTSIGESAFYNCSALASVVIPNSVTSIGASAFYNCSALASVVIPNSVTSIGASAFYNCSALASVVIPNSVTSIGASAFRKCSALASVVIPNSVTSIGESAFRECSSMGKIDIPSRTRIGTYAFEGCKKLKKNII